jgi:hypothetical protein
LNNEVLDNGAMTAAEAGITKDCVLHLLPPPLIGGGKRARSAPGSSTGEVVRKKGNKAERLDAVYEAIGLSGLRVQASPFRHRVLDNAVQRIVATMDNVKEQTNVMNAEFDRMTDEDIVQLQSLMLSSNVDHRTKGLMKIIFKNDLQGFEEIRKLLAHVEAMMLECAGGMLVGDFGTADGAVSWENFSTRLLQQASARGGAAAAAAAARAPRGALG